MSILDVGCGSGASAEVFRAVRPGVEVWGIDPEPSIQEISGLRFDHFILGRYPVDMPERTFDCITFCDSLEHFADPWEVLRTTSDYLADVGVIVASVPNLRFYNVVRRLVLNGEFTYTEAGILDRSHLRFFTRRSLADLFWDCGYEVRSISPGFHARPGRMVKVLRLLGSLTVEFRATHFNVVASAR